MVIYIFIYIMYRHVWDDRGMRREWFPFHGPLPLRGYRARGGGEDAPRPDEEAGTRGRHPGHQSAAQLLLLGLRQIRHRSARRHEGELYLYTCQRPLFLRESIMPIILCLCVNHVTFYATQKCLSVRFETYTRDNALILQHFLSTNTSWLKKNLESFQKWDSNTRPRKSSEIFRAVLMDAT